jgi:nucleoside-diphosphate-sugar epimerase
MNVLITGGTGFIGSHTVRHLAAAGHHVVALHRRDSVPDAIDGVTWVRSDFDRPNWDMIAAAFAGQPRVLVHLATHGVNPNAADWEDCFQWNVVHAIEFWRAAILHGVRRIVTCGSCFEYGAACDRYDFVPPTAAPEPLGPYAASKAAATMALHGVAASHGVEGLVLRPCVVFGEGEWAQRLWPSLKKAALEGRDFPMTSGSQIRDFVPVDTVADALVEGVSRSDLKKGRVCIENVGSGDPRQVKDFASEWWNRWNASGKLLLGVLPDRSGETHRMAPLLIPRLVNGRS